MYLAYVRHEYASDFHRGWDAREQMYTAETVEKLIDEIAWDVWYLMDDPQVRDIELSPIYIKRDGVVLTMELLESTQAWQTCQTVKERNTRAAEAAAAAALEARERAEFERLKLKYSS